MIFQLTFFMKYCKFISINQLFRNDCIFDPDESLMNYSWGGDVKTEGIKFCFMKSTKIDA